LKGYSLEVGGPYACFTRPEMKIERVSYDVITPSAARAIFDAILWKPAIRWRITRIEQRAGLFLRDVNYRLHGEFDFNPQPNADPDETEAKYASMFERRALNGQCFNQPYLGCREFSCKFQLVDGGNGMVSKPIVDSRDLGWMLYDIDFSDPSNPKPMWFRPKMENGIIKVPHPDSKEVRR